MSMCSRENRSIVGECVSNSRDDGTRVFVLPEAEYSPSSGQQGCGLLTAMILRIRYWKCELACLYDLMRLDLSVWMGPKNFAQSGQFLLELAVRCCRRGGQLMTRLRSAGYEGDGRGEVFSVAARDQFGADV
jgi:hypothetical protein